MQLITHHLHSVADSKRKVNLQVDRRKLAKRRFRASAEDGTDFGFDLDHPLKHQMAFFESEEAVYLIDQQPEPVLKISFQDGKTGAYYGWMIGNMHFPADFQEAAVIAEDDPAVRQMLDRNHIPYSEDKAIFQPPSATEGHHHH